MELFSRKVFTLVRDQVGNVLVMMKKTPDGSLMFSVPGGDLVDKKSTGRTAAEVMKEYFGINVNRLADFIYQYNYWSRREPSFQEKVDYPGVHRMHIDWRFFSIVVKGGLVKLQYDEGKPYEMMWLSISQLLNVKIPLQEGLKDALECIVIEEAQEAQRKAQEAQELRRLGHTA